MANGEVDTDVRRVKEAEIFVPEFLGLHTSGNWSSRFIVNIQKKSNGNLIRIHHKFTQLNQDVAFLSVCIELNKVKLLIPFIACKYQKFCLAVVCVLDIEK